MVGRSTARYYRQWQRFQDLGKAGELECYCPAESFIHDPINDGIDCRIEGSQKVLQELGFSSQLRRAKCLLYKKADHHFVT